MEFRNAYGDAVRASAYDKLEFGGTYHLAFRDIPEIVGAHVPGRRALDFGCGTGRSSRFLKELGFEVTGVDIASEMVDVARVRDPEGDYRVIDDGDFSKLPPAGFDLVLSAFTFDNIPGRDRKIGLMRGLGSLLQPSGRFLNIVSTPEIYLNEWVSFTTRDFPENQSARPGDIVRIITTDHPDGRPVEDILWPDEEYRSVYAEAGLEPVLADRPLARGDERIEWVSETDVAPWALYLLRRA
ncbi:MAG TPA: class I SAM-dependent methyltransferase [Candidatus Krumholzibacterium sp.]|nr:class I SAM-dependent methyltransferase [Candidatus Krumholzibacterium sp.]